MVVDFRKVVCENESEASSSMVVPAPKRRKLRVEPLRFSANNLETHSEERSEPTPGPSSARSTEDKKLTSLEYIQRVKSTSIST